MSEYRTKKIGTIGDVNPSEFGGGIVFRTPYGPAIEYCYGAEDNGTKKIKLYRVDVELDVLRDCNWVKVEEICKSAGQDIEEVKRLAKSRRIMDRVFVYELIGGHWGWENLDHDPIELTLAELNKRWFNEPMPIYSILICNRGEDGFHVGDRYQLSHKESSKRAAIRSAREALALYWTEGVKIVSEKFNRHYLKSVDTGKVSINKECDGKDHRCPKCT